MKTVLFLTLAFVVMMAGVAMAETLHPDGKGGYNSSKGHYSPDGKGGLNGPVGHLEPDGAGNFFGPHGEYYENIEGVLDGPDNYDTREGTLVEEVEKIPEVIKRVYKKAHVFNGCISGHWLHKKSNDGSILTLEDGSIWQVDSIDRVSTIIWLPTDSILVCEGDGTLINTDDGEKVYARRLR